jgi:hypothetical protein
MTIREHITILKADTGEVYRVGDAFPLTSSQKSAVAEAAGLDSVDNPTAQDAVRRAATSLDGYESMTSQEIAGALNETVGMQETTLPEVGQLARSNGAVQGEFGNTFSAEYSGYLQRFEDNIRSGDYGAAKMLVEEMPPALKSALSSDTYDAILAAVDSRGVRRVGEYAQDLGVTVPDPVEAADVDAALGR